MNFMDYLRQPWPWYVVGPLIGLVVPALLILGNKAFGISSSMRHLCAACIPTKLPYFSYNWREHVWSFYFVGGIVIGGFIANQWLANPEPVQVSSQTIEDLKQLGVTQFSGLMPSDLFSMESLFSIKGLIFYVLGGFLVGFGTRYAGGCTSGHSITGLANLQWPSLVATICFMVGGMFSTFVLLPLLFKLF
ncbi:MAG: YeeE/YedE thiosulfate transporter family protein [Spirosomataceae bacterium]